jgi:hypothetical protein
MRMKRRTGHLEEADQVVDGHDLEAEENEGIVNGGVQAVEGDAVVTAEQEQEAKAADARRARIAQTILGVSGRASS